MGERRAFEFNERGSASRMRRPLGRTSHARVDDDKLFGSFGAAADSVRATRALGSNQAARAGIRERKVSRPTSENESRALARS